MTQANEPNNYDRQFRHFNRRLERLEDTQVSPQEFERAFNRVYDEIDALEDQMNQRFDRLEVNVTEMRAEMREINNKFDILMRHITGQN
jgi:predicted  nucleic acid-binding Zn-ribbon protein